MSDVPSSNSGTRAQPQPSQPSQPRQPSRPKPTKPTPSVRATQHRWVELLDDWRCSSSRTTTRASLVPEISHHAQLLCRTVPDRAWLVDAFQLGVQAVLSGEEGEEAEELARQILMLGVHSVALPYLDSASTASTDVADARRKRVQDIKEEWEALSRRLGLYERLKGLQQQVLPALPLKMVLQEPTSTVLLCIASLPNGARVVAELLKSEPRLVEESAQVRLQIVKQLLATCGGGGEYASLADEGLLIGWRDGSGESGSWARVKEEDKFGLGDLVQFYRGVIGDLRQNGDTDQARALVDTLASHWSGQDAQRAITQLRTEATSSSSSAATAVPAAQRFDLDSIQTLAAQVSAAGSDQSARRQLAQRLVSPDDTAAAPRITQLIDTHDSPTVRSFALEVASHAKSTALLVATMYARPAVGGFRFDLDTPPSLIEQAEAVVSQLSDGKLSGNTTSSLGEALRTSLTLDPDSAVPACQLFALLQDESGTAVEDARQHLGWLRAVSALVEEAQGDKPRFDMCWMAAFGGDQAKEKQMQAFDELLRSFDESHPAPASGAKTDAAVLRFRAAWDTAFHRFLTLTSATGPFSSVDEGQATQHVLSCILRSGDVQLFTSLSSALPAKEVEDLVLHVSTTLFDSAPVASTRDPHVRLSLDVLSALPSNSAKAQREFVEAACRLSSFKIRSPTRAGQAITPREIRETRDRLQLVSRLLATQMDAHRSAELVLQIAEQLCCPRDAKERARVEGRTLAMLADSAVAGEEFELACGFCQRLIDHVASARKRKEDGEVEEIAWRSSYQLARHPGWSDTAGRMGMLANAMVLAPVEQVGGMLRLWRSLDEQLTEESQKVGAGAGAGATAQTAASVGAGLVGTAANLLPLGGLNFSPLSYFAPTTTTGGGNAKAEEAGVDARTAKLFDFDNVSGASGGGGGTGGYVDPTERAVRAARAARDFLGWREDKQGGGGDKGGFSFSRGMGWLIGDGEGR